MTPEIWEREFLPESLNASFWSISVTNDAGGCLAPAWFHLAREESELMMVMEFVRGETMERMLARLGSLAKRKTAPVQISWCPLQGFRDIHP